MDNKHRLTWPRSRTSRGFYRATDHTAGARRGPWGMPHAMPRGLPEAALRGSHSASNPPTDRPGRQASPQLTSPGPGGASATDRGPGARRRPARPADRAAPPAPGPALAHVFYCWDGAAACLVELPRGVRARPPVGAGPGHRVVDAVLLRPRPGGAGARPGPPDRLVPGARLPVPLVPPGPRPGNDAVARGGSPSTRYGPVGWAGRGPRVLRAASPRGRARSRGHPPGGLSVWESPGRSGSAAARANPRPPPIPCRRNPDRQPAGTPAGTADQRPGRGLPRPRIVDAH
jgi:hypothetical protein